MKQNKMMLSYMKLLVLSCSFLARIAGGWAQPAPMPVSGTTTIGDLLHQQRNNADDHLHSLQKTDHGLGNGNHRSHRHRQRLFFESCHNGCLHHHSAG